MIGIFRYRIELMEVVDRYLEFLQTFPRGQNCRQYDVEIFRLTSRIIDHETWKMIMQSKNGATLSPLPYKTCGIKLHSSSLWTTSMLLGTSQEYRWMSFAKGFNSYRKHFKTSWIVW